MAMASFAIFEEASKAARIAISLGAEVSSFKRVNGEWSFKYEYPISI